MPDVQEIRWGMYGPAVEKLAGEVFTEDGVAIWLDEPQRMLKGRTPRQAVEEGRADDVLGLLDALADGAFF